MIRFAKDTASLKLVSRWDSFSRHVGTKERTASEISYEKLPENFGSERSMPLSFASIGVTNTLSTRSATAAYLMVVKPVSRFVIHSSDINDDIALRYFLWRACVNDLSIGVKQQQRRYGKHFIRVKFAVMSNNSRHAETIAQRKQSGNGSPRKNPKS